MDYSVPAAQQRRIRCVRDGVHALLRDVAFEDFDVISHRA
jgi:hypothetical protein